MHRSHWAFWIVALGSSLWGTACSRQNPFHPVQGKVVYRNEPLSGATVTLHPKTAGPSAVDWPVGLTGPDGTFTLATGGEIGAPAGEYRVTIVCFESPPAKPGKLPQLSTGGVEPEDRLKGAYADPAKSKIAAEIKNGVNQLEPFVLK